MLPCPQSRPEHLAARSAGLGAGLGALLSAGLLLWHGHGWDDVGALLQDKLVVDDLGNTVSEALTGRCVTTFLLVAATMALAFTTAALTATLAFRLNRRLLAFTSLLGQALAALPIAGLAWWMVSGVVNGAHLPVESLIPYVPPPERDQASLAVGRFLWTWLLPLWVLAVPLMGECLHAVSDRLQAAWPLPHTLGLKAGGHPPTDGLPQAFRLAWATLHDHWHSVGLLALGYAVLVEQAFALPGWGAFLADHLHTGSSRGIAAAIYACGWMTAAWALISEAVRRCTLDGPAAHWPARPSPTGGVSLAGGLLLMGGTVLFAGLVPAYHEQSWVRAFFQPWVYGALPPDLAARLQGLIPALRQDLNAALTATALALAVTLVRGCLAWLTHTQDRLLQVPFPGIRGLVATAGVGVRLSPPDQRPASRPGSLSACSRAAWAHGSCATSAFASARPCMSTPPAPPGCPGGAAGGGTSCLRCCPGWQAGPRTPWAPCCSGPCCYAACPPKSCPKPRPPLAPRFSPPKTKSSPILSAPLCPPCSSRSPSCISGASRGW